MQAQATRAAPTYNEIVQENLSLERQNADLRTQIRTQNERIRSLRQSVTQLHAQQEEERVLFNDAVTDLNQRQVEVIAEAQIANEFSGVATVGIAIIAAIGVMILGVVCFLAAK